MAEDVLVVVPVLNEERYVEACVRSAKAQKTKHRVRVVVCDSGSSDRTVEIARKWADAVVVSPVKGTGAQRNFGAQESHSEFILFIDADTTIPPNYVEWGINKFKQKPDILALSAAFKFTERGKRNTFAERATNEYLKFKDSVGAATLPGFNVFIRRDVFSLVGGFKNIPLEDIDLSRRLNEIGETHYFTDLKVGTSARRIENMGMIGAIRYYFEMDLTRKRPDLRDLLVYSDYVAANPSAARIQSAFTGLPTRDYTPMAMTASLRRRVRERAIDAAERLRAEFNETADWARSARVRYAKDATDVSKSLAYLQSKAIDRRIVDSALDYARKARERV
ncbi:Glycosyltransferase AglE [uncultured archaeon]|nr:Glycosyltransferase AglE [uncultured archaeon]